MSLNEKYIINGSTLSDIGDAMRAGGIITPPTAIETAQVLTYSRSYTVQYGSDGQITVQASDFAFTGKTPTAIKIYYSGSSYSNNGPYANKTTNKLTKSWDTAIKVNLPVTVTIPNAYGYTFYGTVYFVPVVANGLGYDYIAQDSSITLPSNSYFWNSLEGAGRTIPNRIQVSDIASMITSFCNHTPEYEYYTLDSTTGTNIHNQTWNSAKAGMNMPEGVDYTKMVYLRLPYSGNYNFIYVRDMMGYFTNSDHSQYFFPCWYSRISDQFSPAVIKNIRSVRSNSNPIISNSWLGIGYNKNSWGQALINGGVKLSSLWDTGLSLNYAGGLGSISYTASGTVAIFEK